MIGGEPGQRKLVVTLHDVAPPFEFQIRSQLERLAAIGVRRCVLNVVPNWHGCHPIGEAGSFLELVLAQLDGGSQLLLHGVEHRSQGRMRGGHRDQLRARLFAGGAAEFLTLPPEETVGWVVHGLSLFADAGLPRPSTFCAPGWLLARDLEPRLAEAGIQHIVGMVSTLDLATGCRRWLPSIGYMGAGARQEIGVALLNGIVRETILQRAAVAQAYLHPSRAGSTPAERRVLGEIAAMVAGGDWLPSTYGDLYGRS